MAALRFKSYPGYDWTFLGETIPYPFLLLTQQGGELFGAQNLTRVAVVFLFIITVTVLRVLFYGSVEADAQMESPKTFVPSAN
jgi:hypothetical protein